MPGAAETLPYQQPFFLRIDFRSNLDGAKFKMHPLSQDDLKWLVPGVRLHPYVFIAHGNEPDQKLDPSIVRHVAELLTGLTHERLVDLGVRVVFMEPHSDATLAEFPAA